MKKFSNFYIYCKNPFPLPQGWQCVNKCAVSKTGSLTIC
uniref:Uncharacterized protein n=1 Tax=Anguilla anguilla TaxID=7936 RepID=A0A0E9QRA1_ANGAN